MLAAGYAVSIIELLSLMRPIKARRTASKGKSRKVPFDFTIPVTGGDGG